MRSYKKLHGLLFEKIVESDPNLAHIEIEALLSGLVSTIGLTALNMASNGNRRDFVREVRSFTCTTNAPRFDFVELPRADLLRKLDACCGLGEDTCEAALATLEEHVTAWPSESKSLPTKLGFAGVGFFCRQGDQFVFELADDLAVVRGR